MDPKSENRLETQTWSAPKGTSQPSLTIPGLTILGHPQIQRIGERAALLDLSSGREALLSRGEPGFASPGDTAFQPLAVPYLSRRPWVLQSTGLRGFPEPDQPVKTSAIRQP